MPSHLQDTSHGVSLQEVVDALVGEVVSEYRIAQSRARELVETSLVGQQKLTNAISTASSLDRLARTRAFRDARKRAKKIVYYTLRQYKGGEEDLEALVGRLRSCSRDSPEWRSATDSVLRGHASTRERLDDATGLHSWLVPHLAEARTLLDVACGVYPVMFPFAELPRIERYVAVDRDAVSVAVLEAWAATAPEPRLHPVLWSLEEGWEPLLKLAGDERFDVALLLKLVAVVERQQSELSDLIAQVPARCLVVSGSRHSLTKRQSIERRERASLRSFTQRCGRRVMAEFTSNDEFVVILK